MRLCIICGDALPQNARADKRFCSGRCRMHSYRQLAPALPTEAGSRYVRQQLRVTQPIGFGALTDQVKAHRLFPYMTDTHWVEPAQYDGILDTMNILYRLWRTLDDISGFDQNIAYSSEEYDQLKDPLLLNEGTPAWDIITDRVAELHTHHNQLRRVRGKMARLVAPRQTQMSHQFDQVIREIRLYVSQHCNKKGPYTINFSTNLQLHLDNYRDELTLWWFELCDS